MSHTGRDVREMDADLEDGRAAQSDMRQRHGNQGKESSEIERFGGRRCGERNWRDRCSNALRLPVTNRAVSSA